MNTFLETIPLYSRSTFTLPIGEIRKDEVLEAIKQLNVGKNPGPDGLPTEFYQLYIDEVINLLTSMYNEGLHSGCMGDSFYEGAPCTSL